MRWQTGGSLQALKLNTTTFWLRDHLQIYGCYDRIYKFSAVKSESGKYSLYVRIYQKTILCDIEFQWSYLLTKELCEIQFAVLYQGLYPNSLLFLMWAVWLMPWLVCWQTPMPRPGLLPECHSISFWGAGEHRLPRGHPPQTRGAVCAQVASGQQEQIRHHHSRCEWCALSGRIVENSSISYSCGVIKSLFLKPLTGSY